MVDTTNFFAILVRFCASWKSAEAENIKRDKLKKAQELQKELENNNRNNAKENKNEKNAQNMKKNHASLINELKNKNNRKPMNHISPAEVEVSYKFYPHFGMSPSRGNPFQPEEDKENLVVNKCLSRMELLSR